MDRLIGIDYGLRRTGVAVSDPLGIFASALDTVDSTKLIDYLKNYAILGQLRKAFPDIPVTLEDERFTSVLAHQVMIDGGMKASGRKDKASVDKISAAIILQGYLDRTNGSSAAFDPSAVPDSLSLKKTKKRKK